MEQGKKVKGGTVAITIAILVLAASIFFTGFKITSMINTSVDNLRVELKKELKKDLRREIISFIYAYRSGAVEDRQINTRDLEKGYQFADRFLSK